MTLDMLEVGQRAQIQRILLNEEGVRRLTEIGIGQGGTVVLVGTAPFGDPLMLDVGSFCVALRCSDAQKIKITKLNN